MPLSTKYILFQSGQKKNAADQACGIYSIVDELRLAHGTGHLEDRQIHRDYQTADGHT